MADRKSPLTATLPADITADGGPAEVARFKDKATATGVALNKQPKVRVRLKEDHQFIINGYVFLVKGGEPVDVPEQIAEMIYARAEIGDDL